ncbi:hypothetical protein KKF61_03870 [Patescibacteria group bacterium]|nr:hypothetical protein [Patescibacteria group bacterium]MBU0963947.1 hypothetical protein [Patescibacteria group bacterium]
MEDLLSEIINFFTDPDGVGFPILLAASLGIILFLMNYSSKGWTVSSKKNVSKQNDLKKRNYPFKPF